MDSFVGKFDFVESSGLDSYLRSLGVGLILRKVMSVSSPSIEISQDPVTKVWTFKMISIFHTHELKFKLNEGVDGDETLDGRPCKTTVTLKQNALVMDQVGEDGPPNVIVTLQNYENGTLKLSNTAAEGNYGCFLIFKPTPSSPTGGH